MNTDPGGSEKLGAIKVPVPNSGSGWALLYGAAGHGDPLLLQALPAALLALLGQDHLLGTKYLSAQKVGWIRKCSPPKVFPVATEIRLEFYDLKW